MADNMKLHIIVASLPSTRKRGIEISKKMGLVYPPIDEYICQECKGECFISEGTFKGASKKAQKNGAILMILCETCAEASMDEGAKLHIPQEQIDELKKSGILDK